MEHMNPASLQQLAALFFGQRGAPLVAELYVEWPRCGSRARGRVERSKARAAAFLLVVIFLIQGLAATACVFLRVHRSSLDWFCE